MKITLLGTGSPIPDPNRAGPSTLVRTGTATVLVDCGRGVLLRLTAAGVLPPMLSAVFLTHLHSDHISDLNDVRDHALGDEPGPHAVAHLRSARDPAGRRRDARDAGAGHRVPARAPRRPHAGSDARGDRGRSRRHVHDRLDERRRSGGPITVRWSRRSRSASKPTGSPRCSVATACPCDGLDELCHGADAYVQTVLREDIVRMVPNPRFQEILDYHSSVEDAARTATKAGVGTLVLTHYIPGMVKDQEGEWRALAAEHFSGPIVLGDDLTELDL